MRIGIQICSIYEWESIKRILGIESREMYSQPFGQYFMHSANGHEEVFYQSGDTKTRAAAACQYAIDRWHPGAVVNLGTCGGVLKGLKKLDLIMANRTVQYDCIIHFGEKSELFYKPMITRIDTSWVDIRGVTPKLHRGTIATADQNLDHEWREILRKKNVLGADWESGAIAKICKLNSIRCLILRGVSDIPKGLVTTAGRDPQGRDWIENTPKVMEALIQIMDEIRLR